MNPKHSSPRSPDRTAKAPYNFVPLPERVVTVDRVPEQDIYEGHTGYIECRLVTLSPLYTRGVRTPEAFAQWGSKAFHELPPEEQRESSRFFYIDDDGRPVIPGSSLRGMVRTMVEIAGYGKVQWVTDKRLVYRAVGDSTSLGTHYREQLLGANKARAPHTHLDYPSPKLKGGYLRRVHGGWAIQRAKEHHGESFVHVEYDDASSVTGGHYRCQRVHDVFVEPAPRKTLNRGKRGRGDLILDVAVTQRVIPATPGQSPPEGMVPAKLIESGHMGGHDHPKHWHCAIFEPNPAEGLIPIPDKKWALYQEDRDLTRGLATRKLTNDGDPLFYLLDDNGELEFFGPTKMFRLLYAHSPFDLIADELKEESVIDLAEAIFGFTKSNEIPAGDRARAGRVFFGDARLLSDPEKVWLSAEPIPPRILGSPKPTSFQNYLTQQEPDDMRRLDHYATAASPHPTTIRGHKLYWHRGEVGLAEIQEHDENALQKHPKQYTRIQPIAAGAEFEFRIRFENLRDFELGALLWALMLPGEPDKTYCHKLGMGKPLGMGAVRLESTLYLSNRAGASKNGRYRRLFASVEENGSEPHEPRWHLAESKEPDPSPYLESFEAYVLNCMDQQERGRAQSLQQVARIKMLLRMLEWPGPHRSATEYARLSEFRSRPVLPDPLSLPTPGGDGRLSTSPRRTRPGAQRTTRRPQPEPATQTPGARLSGVVKRFNEQKGFGFIQQEGGEDIFVHFSEIEGEGQRSLIEGQRVTYEVGQGRGGRTAAKKVRPE